MYKESWGLKRICPMCSKQYYDLGKTELECQPVLSISIVILFGPYWPIAIITNAISALEGVVKISSQCVSELNYR